MPRTRRQGSKEAQLKAMRQTPPESPETTTPGRTRKSREPRNRMRDVADAQPAPTEVTPQAGQWWRMADGKSHLIVRDPATKSLYAALACPAKPQLYKGLATPTDPTCTDCQSVYARDPRAPAVAILRRFASTGLQGLEVAEVEAAIALLEGPILSCGHTIP